MTAIDMERLVVGSIVFAERPCEWPYCLNYGERCGLNCRRKEWEEHEREVREQSRQDV